MSHPNPTGNGCTLEDCHTNVFALTDLTGIQWRRLSVDTVSLDILDDPVLQSFSSCLQSDILCVWRRVLRSTEQRMAGNLHYSNELWIFWSGKEPASLSSVLSPELKVCAEGSWDVGLSYECRTLLFKAIHNLIERCLLSRGFLRLGKWFVQLSDAYVPLSSKSCHLSFCFNFFLHGESTVCASIEVKQHYPVLALQTHDLNYALLSQSNVNVILGPYGLNGTLTGQSYRDTDSESVKILSEWNKYYKVHEPCRREGEGMEEPQDNMPALVEVIICGVRMKYPSQFVFIANIDHMSSGVGHEGGDAGAPRSPNLMSTKTAQSIVSGRITEKVTQDFSITTGTAKRSHDSINDEKPRVTWDLHESSTKVSCACSSRHRSKSKGSASSKTVTGKHGKDKNDKMEKTNSRRTSLNFHHRKPSLLTGAAFDMEVPVHHTAPSSSGPHSQQQQQPTPSDSAGMTDPSSNAPSTGTAALTALENNNPNAAESPMSDPSPLDHSQSVPAQTDPLMPTLSPQPPTVKDKDSGSSKPSTLSLRDEAPGTTGKLMAEASAKPHPQMTDISPSKPPECGAKPKPALSLWLNSQKSLAQGDLNCLKKPVLPFTGVEAEEVSVNALYDFVGLNSWFDYAAKRARADTVQHNTNMVTDVYCATNGVATPMVVGSSGQMKVPSPQADPYEFMDDTSIEPGGLSRYRNSRDDLFPRQHIARMEEDMKMRASGEAFPFDEKGPIKPVGSPPTPGGGTKQFTSVIQLQPNPTDLDHMFESSSSENEENALSPSMTNFDDMDGVRLSKKKHKMMNAGSVGSIGVAELTRMYPTPPSLENHNNAHSPGMPSDMTPDAHMMGRTMEKYERIYTSDDPAKEVFKPTKVFEHVNSMKYASVELPSENLSPLPLPPHYKPMWPYNVPLHDRMPHPSQSHSMTYLNVPSVETAASRYTLSDSSPAAMYAGSVHQQQRTPLSYELTSPASNASSYLNKNLNSVDNHCGGGGATHELPEAHGLVVNVMLSDSLLNLFRDHNFDSCNICVCNMSIVGSDVGLYLPDAGGVADTELRCSCGFSAVMNRKHGHNAGLFYEDECDITGCDVAAQRDQRDPLDRERPQLLVLEPATTSKEQPTTLSEKERTTQEIMQLLVGNFCLSIPSGSVMFQMNKLANVSTMSNMSPYISYLLIKDGNEAAYSALEQGLQAMEHCAPSKPDDSFRKLSLLHKWPFLQAGSQRVPLNSQDIVWLLRSLLPLLQDAIQKKRMAQVWENSYPVSGPLSWKDFHNIAGRGSVESCQPQPIPSLLVGHDKDWLSLSPYILQHWDKLMLEPCGKQRDITYVVVCPENDFILDNVKRFFHDLSTIYEMCRLGRHQPLPKKLRDGILRVGDKTRELSCNPVDEWFNQLGESAIAAKLKLYALACRYHLGPILSQQTLDKNLFESPPAKNTMYRSQPSPKPPPTPENCGSVNSSQTTQDENKENAGDVLSVQRDPTLTTSDPDCDDHHDTPALVVYLVDPFTYGSDYSGVDRVATLGLMHAYHHMLRALPDAIQPHVNLQIVPLQMIVDQQQASSEMQQIKCLAFSVFAMCRWNITQSIIGRSLTSFGPAAAAEMLLKKQETEKMGKQMRLYSPPFVLAPIKTKQMQLAETCSEKLELSNVVFCAYCLSDDQRWLMATVTDEKGELLNTCTVNIDIPKRTQRRNVVARKHGLKKLWDFILGVVSLMARSCRLVVGRFGRLGHGELKGWSGLLSKENLRRTNKRMRDICRQCGLGTDSPSILSGCMVSMEAQPTFRVMPDSLNKEEYMSSNCPLETPRDASCTHILVFPTSATAQANTEQQIPLDDIFSSDVVGDDDQLLDDYDLFTDSFMGWPTSPNTSPAGSPHNGGVGASGSPGMEHGSRHSPGMKGAPPTGGASVTVDPQDQPSNLSQQPLAMGYYVSTARTGPLPRWFSSSSPDIENSCPAIFKCSLHIRTSLQLVDEFMSSAQTHSNHPLDSSLTCDVLRYVLENYNALSWLTMDPVLNDRRSCLPIHIAVLLQMYHSLNSLISTHTRP